MDHTFADAHPMPIALESLQAGPRLSRMMGEIRSYGYRPTPANGSGPAPFPGLNGTNGTNGVQPPVGAGRPGTFPVQPPQQPPQQ